MIKDFRARTVRRIGVDHTVLRADRLLVVSRADMDDWQVRAYRPALIRFDGRTWRLARRTPGAKQTIHYELVPWTAAELDVSAREIDYGPDYVAARERARVAQQRTDRVAVLLQAMAPLTGFLPARTKGRLEMAYGIDPVASTRHSLYIQYLAAINAIAVAAIGTMTSGALLVTPSLLVAAVVMADGVVRWDRMLWEERPPPGFYEWIARRSPSQRS